MFGYACSCVDGYTYVGLCVRKTEGNGTDDPSRAIYLFNYNRVTGLQLGKQARLAGQ